MSLALPASRLFPILATEFPVHVAFPLLLLHRLPRIGLALAAALFLAQMPAARGEAPPVPSAAPVSFIKDVAPILKESCYGCHGAKNPKGRLDMTKYDTFRKGGTKDDPIVPGKPDDSYIIDVVTATDKSRMPPREAGSALPKEKIAVLQRWIDEGQARCRH